MLKHLLSCGVLLLAFLSTGAQAGTTQSNLVINLLQPEGAGILVGFTVRPTDCTMAYKGGHAYLGTGIKDFDSLYLALTTAKVTGTPVTIYYADNGDCSSTVQLLSLSNVVIN
jgi:hypothetical protein